jgi:tungstate transport system substrate-binding protein
LVAVRRVLCLALVLGVIHEPILRAQRRPVREVVLATTTSLYETGLLDSLAPIFRARSGFTLRAVAVGSGQALRLAERGDADVVLAHAPAAEAAFMAAGFGTRRRVVAYNYFTIAGPPGDPARVRTAAGPAQALRQIATSWQVFVSRGDSSGTHRRELALWAAAGGRPAWRGYLETGQGMSTTLLVADERRGYTLTDRGTLAWLRSHVDLVALGEADTALLNVYHVIEVNPRGRERVNAEGARAFADFVTSQEVQDLLLQYGRAALGQPLFVPARGVEP